MQTREHELLVNIAHYILNESKLNNSVNDENQAINKRAGKSS